MSRLGCKQRAMDRRHFIATAAASCLLTLAPREPQAHSPWGHYAVYRQKHLLVLSTRDDPDSYGYSEHIVEAINRFSPEASARRARAVNLERAFNLLRTDQFQFALLSRTNIDAMREASGAFAGYAPVDLKTIYQFNQLELVVVGHFADELVAIVANAVLTQMADLPGALPLEIVLKFETLHPGARAAMEAL